jgi:hypothetical protein
VAQAAPKQPEEPSVADRRPGTEKFVSFRLGAQGAPDSAASKASRAKVAADGNERAMSAMKDTALSTKACGYLSREPFQTLENI